MARIPAGTRDLLVYLLQNVQIGFRTHTATYSKGPVTLILW